MVTMGQGSDKAKLDEGKEAAADAPEHSPLSRLINLFRLACCQRRRSREAREASYGKLLDLGRKIPEQKQTDWYEKLAWWSDAKTKRGARVFVLAPRGPQGETDHPIDMSELLAFALTKMDKTVVKENTAFAVVWVQLSDHRVWPWQAWRFSELLHARYADNLEAVHVIHPSWTIRILRLFLWPLASDEFWDYFYAHERIEFLDTHIDFGKFRLPKDVYEYDKWLDQQAAELSKSNAMRHGGAFGGMGMGMGMDSTSQTDEEKKKFDIQMEEMKRLLEQQGQGGKKLD
eukprot:TRINITY_DN5061_c0_g1_i1.p1 TRINITY_DN5061_c0_g1~~TRINITY_DN5061_c0_g1_i1.p1  ORF type:complete len:300 (+),score=58.07 TRINITY_DN5061_c0_g1_i1:38-901(+)